MFSNKTYENILANMLSRVTDDVDKKEGSIIYDALAPCAYELAQAYFTLDNFIDLVFVDTASGEYLDKYVSAFGVTRKQATNAIRKIETTGIVELGTRWGVENIYYAITEKLTDTSYKAICNEVGTIGNIYNGALGNMDNASGITATLTDILESGANEETDTSLRNRFYIQVRRPATSGNIYNYINWALEVEGVGDVKVFPLWNGAGTVKVLIVNSDMNIDTTLETKVYEHIEQLRPIGALVTVSSPTIINININAEITLDNTQDLQEVKSNFEENIRNYIKQNGFKVTTLSYAKIGSILLSTTGVLDYTNLTVNNATSNIFIGDEGISNLNIITLSEVV